LKLTATLTRNEPINGSSQSKAKERNSLETQETEELIAYLSQNLSSTETQDFVKCSTRLK
jgi:hypothetical protein